MMTRMAEALGYDENGNADRLLAVDDAVKIEHGFWRRGSGETVCERCGMSFNLHPKVQGALWLTRTCEGLVKL